MSPSPGILGLPLPIPLPLVDSWINPNGGDWNNPFNWSLGVPQAGFHVQIDLPGANFTVTHSSWRTGSFFSLTLGSTATLMVTGGSLSGNMFNNTGTFVLGPGTSAYLGTLNDSGTSNVQGGYLGVSNLIEAGNFILGAGGSANILKSFTNTGSVDVQGGALTAANITQAGTLTLEAGTSASISNTMINTGTVNVLSGADLSATSYSQTSGATNLSNGLLDSPNQVSIQGGTLTGPGTINADLLNGGEISPGAPGTLTINGNYSQARNGILDIGLGGTNAGVDFDQVLITGAASLDGVLNVSYLNGFAPSAGQSFQVMQFSSSLGSFAAINGLDPGNGTTLVAQYDPQDFTLLVQSVVPITPPNPPPPPPILPPLGSPPANQSASNNTNTGTNVPPPNFQTLPGLVTPGQGFYYTGGGSQGYAPVGGFSDVSSAKRSEDVAFLGGSGDDEQMTMLDFPVQLNMTSDEDVFSASEIAATLLIGARPKLLPQKGSQVAPVATLLTDDTPEEAKTIVSTEEENPLQNFLINPLGRFNIDEAGSLESSLPIKAGEDLALLGLDKVDESQSPKKFPTLSSLIVLAGALVALWCAQKYRGSKVKPAQSDCRQNELAT